MRRRSGIGAAAAVIAACIFGAALLVSLITGAGVYRQVQERVERSAARRTGLSYVTAKLHSHDVAGAVRTGSFGDTDALFLMEETEGGSYETILYIYNGWLMELLCAQGAGLGPEAGQQITEAQRLTVRTEDSLLRIAFVDGNGVSETADVFLRSGYGQ